MPVAESTYKRAAICYWSGTGNSYRVAQWMGQHAAKKGAQSLVLSCAEARSADLNTAGDECFFAIVFPTHGFTAPWQVVKFVLSLPRANSTRIHCAATRAGLKCGPLFIPGISGSALFVVALLLLFKGYRVQGVVSVDMPSNWYSLHPIQRRKSHTAIIERAHDKVGGFMEKTWAGTKVWCTTNVAYEVILGLLLLPISVVYLLFGKFFLAKLFFANSRCDGCGLCETHCPVGGIAMRGTVRRRPYWKYNCESCMRCASICPRNAIEAGHSWGVVLYVITVLPFSTYLFSLVGADGVTGGEAAPHWLGNVLDIFYFYPAIFISYFAFSLLIRIPLINYLFTRTTLTHFRFWGLYREPQTKLRDIS